MKFSSFRRLYLDKFLSATPFEGDVIDVGGKKMGKKGQFRPPLSHCRSWRYVNVDAASQPDFIASADALPLESASVDWVLLSEVLEHLRSPEKSLAEAFRVLRLGGRIALSVPFLYPVHGDPFDFQRWTPEKFRAELGAAGFSEIEVRPMGGVIGALVDIFEGFCQQYFTAGRSLPLPYRGLRFLVRRIFFSLLLRWDHVAPFQLAVTGGYFITAGKAR